jgi:hypothetical protein
LALEPPDLEGSALKPLERKRLLLAVAELQLASLSSRTGRRSAATTPAAAASGAALEGGRGGAADVSALAEQLAALSWRLGRVEVLVSRTDRNVQQLLGTAAPPRPALSTSVLTWLR